MPLTDIQRLQLEILSIGDKSIASLRVQFLGCKEGASVHFLDIIRLSFARPKNFIAQKLLDKVSNYLQSFLSSYRQKYQPQLLRQQQLEVIRLTDLKIMTLHCSLQCFSFNPAPVIHNQMSEPSCITETNSNVTYLSSYTVVTTTTQTSTSTTAGTH